MQYINIQKLVYCNIMYNETMQYHINICFSTSTDDHHKCHSYIAFPNSTTASSDFVFVFRYPSLSRKRNGIFCLIGISG